MSTNGRRSSFLNIDEWLDRCSNLEPDSVIYEQDYADEAADMKTKQNEPEMRNLYWLLADKCSKIGLPQAIIEERLIAMDECWKEFYKTNLEDINNEYEVLCRYKEELLSQIQKMTSDLYLPAFVPEDNITLLQHCKKLKVRFNELNAVKEERMKRLQELRDKQSRHCLVLGIKTPEIKLQTDIPTEEELKKLNTAVLDLEREEKRRIEKYALLKDMIAKCMEDLEYEPENDFERSVLSDKPSYIESYLLKMGNLHSKLESLYTVNRDRYNKLIDRLVSLYDRLEVEQSIRDAFLESHSICKPSYMTEIEAEIERYEELKRQNIGKFIEKIKDELIVEYERCFVSQEQQDSFFALSTVSGECNDEILELYEREVVRIKKFYADNQAMLEKFHKWRTMWKELIDLEVKAGDPNRFNNRGGQLLIEEKKRKALQKGLPMIEEQLRKMNRKYTEENDGKNFKIFDTNVDEFIAGCWDELSAAKEEEKRERQRAKMTNSVATRGAKPVPSQVAIKRTPMKRAAGAGVTPTPSKLQRSIHTPNQNTFKSSTQNLAASGSVRKLAPRNIFQQNNQQAGNRNLGPSGAKSNIPTSKHISQQSKDKTTISNGSEISALSLSEQEFEEEIVRRPASAKRTR